MRKYTEHCDLCDKEFNHDKNGFKAEIGYSCGGWGSRKDFVPKISVEVCNSCFKELEVKSKELQILINKLRES